jgi:trimeric autotransporter adhesin
MIKYYNFLSSSIRAEYKSGVGDRVGSPPKAKHESTSKSWITLLLLFLSLTMGQIAEAQVINSTTYPFSTSSGAALEDMSTGTTLLVGSGSDDGASTVQNLGFEFWFVGNRYTQFSANANGLVRLGSVAVGGTFVNSIAAITNVPQIAPYFDDLATGTNGRVNYKVVGTAPNRRLVIDWLVTIPRSTGGVPAASFQVWLYETTNVIEYRYGNGMVVDATNSGASIGFGTSATQFSSVTLNATSTSSTCAYGVANDTNTIGITAGTAFTFTPVSTPPADPTTLTFTAVTLNTTTPNWVDNSTDEIGFVVTRALDAGFTSGVVSTFVASTTTATTGTAYSLPQTGLSPGTTYFYKIQSSIEGAGSTPGLTGSQATTAGITYYWVGASGTAWGTAANWNTAADGTGSPRTTALTSDVLIVDGAGIVPGAALTISVDTASFSVGQFQITSNTNCTLVSSAVTTRVITITGGGGNDFVIEAGSTLNLLSTTNAVAFGFSGAANTGDISGTYNAAGSTANTINTTGGTGTLVTVSSTGVVANNIVGSSGCMLGSVATLSFASGSNYSHGSFTTTNGFIPLATWATSSTVTITGGTTSTAITNPTQSFGNFVYNSASSTGTMSVWTTGTTAVIKGNLTITQTGTGVALFRATTTGRVTVNGNLIITAGRFQVGNATATANGVIVLGNTSIASAGILDINSAVFSQRGPLLTNDGTMTGTAAASTLQMLSFDNIAQTIAGSGTVLTNIGVISVQNGGGVTITHANQIPILRANLFVGTVTGSDKLTFGTGAALNTVTQIGAAALTTPGGSFDAIPAFNLGTGTYGVIYAQESVSRTTGFEIPATRSIAFLTESNSNGLTIAGGPLATTTLTFAAGTGNITTSSSNVLTVTGTTPANIVRTSLTAFVNGPLEITLPASLVTGSTYVLPVGKSTVNPFALVNPTTNAGGTVVVQSEVFDGSTGGTPGLNISSISSSRYWAASITSGAANFTDALIQLNDDTTGRDAIAGSSTLTGAYDLQGGAAITTTPSSLTTTPPANTTLPGFFLMANKAAATLSNLVISPIGGGLCANVARTVTVDVTPGGGTITGVVINYSVNGVAQTAISMTNVTGNGGLALDTWSGVIPTVTPSGGLVTWSVTATDSNTLTKTEAGTSYQDEPLFGVTATASASVSNICAVGSSVLTAAVLTNQIPPAPAASAYCASTHASGCLGDNISRVVLNTLDKLTGTTCGTTSAAYSNFSGQTGANTTTLTAGTAYSLSLTFGTDGSQFFGAWIDYNHNGVYEASEFLGASGNAGASGTIAVSFTPSTSVALNGLTRMRIVGGNDSAVTSTQACGASSSGFGETQDYDVTIVGGLTTLAVPIPYTGTIDSYTWNDGTSDVGTGNNLSVSPTVTTTYTASIVSNGCTIVSSPVTVNVVALPTAPTQVNFDPTCGTAVPVVSVSDPNGFTTPTINWYADNTATTPLQSSTSTTFNSIINTTTTYFVSVVNPTTGCESLRTSVTAIVNTPDPIDTIANQSICLADTFSATATSVNGAYAYTWSAVPSVGSGVETPVTGASQTILPTVAGTYTYTVAATDGICFTSTTFTVTVGAYPVFSSVSATPTSLCADGISTLTATIPGSLIFTASTGATLDPMTGATNVITTSNDDTPTAAPAAIGFTFNFNGVDYTQYSVSPDGWILLGGATAVSQFTNATTSTTNTPKLYPYWDDLATGTNGNVRTLVTGTAPNRIFKVEWNVTIPRALAGVANSTFQAWLYESSNKVEYRYGTMGAQTSNSISAGYTVNATTFSSITFSSGTASTVTANDANNSVPTSGTMYAYTLPVPGNVTWSPLTDLYTDAAATIPYTGTNASVVYSKPVTTTIYTATLEGAGGCNTDSAPITVTQNNIEIAEITGGATEACLGSSVVDFDSLTTGITWTSSNPAVATVDANGLLTLLSVGTTTIGAFIFDTGTNCTSLAPNTVTVTVYAPLAITTQPAPQSVLPSTVATFSIAATGSIVSYQWQVSPNNSTWSNLANDATYSNVGTNTLTINADTPLNGLYYRCVVSGNGSCATPLNSNSAQLSVNELAISDDPDAVTLCTTGTGEATFNVEFTGATPEEVIWEYFDLTDWVVLDGTETTLGAVTYSTTFTPAVFPSTISLASLTLNNLAVINNGWKVRANGIVGAVTVTSAEALITINTPATISQNPGNASACFSGATSSFSVIAAGGLGYQWQYATSSTGPWSNVVDETPAGATYSGATSDTLNVTTTAATPAAGTYFYQLVVTSPASCADAVSTPAQLQIKTPTITVSATPSVICNPGGAPVALLASGAGDGGSYSWSPATGLSASTGDSVTASPTVTTTYTVTGTDATGCSNTASVIVTVGNTPSATATATPATVCSGSNSQLLVNVAGRTVNGYGFVASSGTYTPLTGGTNSTATGDDGTETNIPIGFDFGYNSSTFNTFGISTNGTIQLGGTATSFTNNLATNANVIAALWDDNNRGTGAISYLTSGTAPNRVLTVEWSSIALGGGGSSANSNNTFQMKLFEGSNEIKFFYGNLGPTNALTASIGLSGAVGTFLSVTPASPVASSTTSSGAANNGISSIANLPSGTVYTFTPPSFTYSWSPSTFIAGQENLENPIATAVTADTTYTVTITSSAGCTSTAEVSVSVSTGIAITTPPANTSTCEGASTTFTVVATGSGLSYQWRRNGVDIPGEIFATYTIPVTTAANAGNYDVVINSACADPAVTSSVAVLTVFPTPTATAPSAQTFCSGTATAPVALSGTPGGVTFNITGGTGIGLADQTGVLEIPSFTALTGTATLSIVPVANGCLGNPVTVLITVNETPSAVIVSPSAPTIACGGDPVLLSATGGTVAPSSYCIPTVTQVGETDDNITNFTFAGINNTTGDGPGDYNAYLSPSAVVTAGSATPFSITPNPAFGQQFRIWVDMNQNGVFEATESVFATTTSTTATVSGNITIPTTAFNGTTRLRIADRFSSAVAATEACGHTSFGEYEDYTVTISGATPAPVPLYVWTSTGGGLFTDAAGTVAYTGTPAATVYADPVASATITATSTVAGCTSSGSASVTVGSCDSVVNLKLFIEGYYDTSNPGFMKPVKNNQDLVSPMDEVSNITVELRDVTDPNIIVATTTAVLKTNGDAVCTFTTAPSGSFYISVKMNNIIRTWSASPQTVGSTPLTYDFSNAANKAFGDNMTLIPSTSIYAFFSGDLDDDGNIANSDYSIWETDANNFESGVFATDLDGDGNVANSDYPIWENNANNFVSEIRP